MFCLSFVNSYRATYCVGGYALLLGLKAVLPQRGSWSEEYIFTIVHGNRVGDVDEQRDTGFNILRIFCIHAKKRVTSDVRTYTHSIF